MDKPLTLLVASHGGVTGPAAKLAHVSQFERATAILRLMANRVRRAVSREANV